MANVLTNRGRNIITGRIKGLGSGIGSAEPLYSAIGTGAGTSTVSDTALFTEAGSRVLGTSSLATTTVTSDTWQLVATHSAGSTLAVTNAGNFDASTAGNIMLHADFSTVNLAAGDSIQITYSLQFN